MKKTNYEFITFLSTLCPPEKQFVISFVFTTQFRDPSDLLKLPGWFETHVRGSSWINFRDINYNQDENANFCSAVGKLWQVYRGKQLIKLYLSLYTRKGKEGERIINSNHDPKRFHLQSKYLTKHFRNRVIFERFVLRGWNVGEKESKIKRL